MHITPRYPTGPCIVRARNARPPHGSPRSACRTQRPQNRKGQKLAPLAFSGCLCSSSKHASTLQPLRQAPGRPVSCLLQLGCLLRRPGCPGPAEFLRAGDEVSSCPDPSVLRPCQRRCFRFPRCIHPSALLGSIPQVSLISLASSFRCPGPPMTFPGQPRSASSGFTGDRVAGRPALRSFSATCFAWLSVPSPAWPVAPKMCPRASPGTASSGGKPAIELRVSPPLISFSGSGCSAPGVPETEAPPAPPLTPPRASPGTASSGSCR
jgi:hypothetical protein